MSDLDTINEKLRDHNRFTGDGLPNEPVAAPLPTGDPLSGPHRPSLQDFRDSLGSAVVKSGENADQAAVSASSAQGAIESAVTGLTTGNLWEDGGFLIDWGDHQNASLVDAVAGSTLTRMTDEDIPYIRFTDGGSDTYVVVRQNTNQRRTDKPVLPFGDITIGFKAEVRFNAAALTDDVTACRPVLRGIGDVYWNSNSVLTPAAFNNVAPDTWHQVEAKVTQSYGGGQISYSEFAIVLPGNAGQVVDIRNVHFENATIAAEAEQAAVDVIASSNFGSRADAEAAQVSADINKISVVVGDTVIDYVRDADATALTTGDGATWSPSTAPFDVRAWGELATITKDQLRDARAFAIAKNASLHMPAGTYYADGDNIVRTFPMLWHPMDDSAAGGVPYWGLDQRFVFGQFEAETDRLVVHNYQVDADIGVAEIYKANLNPSDLTGHAAFYGTVSPYGTSGWATVYHAEIRTESGTGIGQNVEVRAYGDDTETQPYGQVIKMASGSANALSRVHPVTGADTVYNSAAIGTYYTGNSDTDAAKGGWPTGILFSDTSMMADGTLFKSEADCAYGLDFAGTLSEDAVALRGNSISLDDAGLVQIADASGGQGVGYSFNGTERIFLNVDSTPAIFMNGDRVLATRQPAIAALATDGSETSETMSAKINEIIEMLRSHGLIAS